MPKKSARSTAHKPAAKKPRTVTKTSLRKSGASTPKPKAPAKSPTRKSKTASLKSAVRRANVFPRESGPRKWVLPTMESGYARLVSREQYEADAAARGTGTARRRRRPRGRAHDDAQHVAAGSRRNCPRRGRPEPLAGPACHVSATQGGRIASHAHARGGPAAWRGHSGREELGADRTLGGAERTGAGHAGRRRPCGGNRRRARRAARVRRLRQRRRLPFRRRRRVVAVADGRLRHRPDELREHQPRVRGYRDRRGDPDRIYVGTGEGDTYAIFSSRIPMRCRPTAESARSAATTGARRGWPRRRRPDRRGWRARRSSPLPSTPAIARTSWRRRPRGSTSASCTDGTPLWTRRRSGVYSSVVVASSTATTRFFAPSGARGSFESRTERPGRPSAPGSRRATSGGSRSRCSRRTRASSTRWWPTRQRRAARACSASTARKGSWKTVANLARRPAGRQRQQPGRLRSRHRRRPARREPDLPRRQLLSDHGVLARIDLAVPGASEGSAYSIATGDSIGGRVHADVHVLVHSPGDPNALWAGCDGGVFLNRAPRGSGAFRQPQQRARLPVPHLLRQHPTDPGDPVLRPAGQRHRAHRRRRASGSTSMAATAATA